MASNLSRFCIGKDWNFRSVRRFSALNQNTGLAGARQENRLCQSIIGCPKQLSPVSTGFSSSVYFHSNLGLPSSGLALRPTFVTRQFSATSGRAGRGGGEGSGSGEGKGRFSYARREHGIRLLIFGVVCYAIESLVPPDIRRVLDVVGGIAVVLGVVLIALSFL